MKKLVVLVVIGVVACILSSANLSAQDAAKKKGDKARPTADERFKKLDADNDGCLTLEEFKASLRGPLAEKVEEIFKLKDADKDGKVSLDEFKKTSFAEFAVRFDEDKDGKITPEELKKSVKRAEMADKMFKARDKNGDGVITEEDFAVKAKKAKQGGGKKGKKAANKQ